MDFRNNRYPKCYYFGAFKVKIKISVQLCAQQDDVYKRCVCGGERP